MKQNNRKNTWKSDRSSGAGDGIDVHDFNGS